MKHTSRWALFVLLLLLSSGCGVFTAGTWEDDPGNWERAFRSTKPDDVTVIHSKYWRSAHWSYEFRYFFEIAPNAKLKDQLFTQNKMREIPADQASTIRRIGDAPTWFAPKDAAAYEVWRYAEEPVGDFQVLIDRETATMYLSDSQL